MQKVFLGILGLLVLFLAAANTRLQNQTRLLAERLEAAEKRMPRTVAPRDSIEPQSAPTRDVPPVVTSEPPKAAPPPGAVIIDPAKSPGADPAIEPLQLAGKALTITLSGDQATLVRVGGDEDLGLTDAQQKAIADLRKRRDEQTEAYSDLIRRIEEQTRQAIRQLLSPEQLAKYDAQNPAPGAAVTFDLAEEPKTASGLRHGYLGISGEDAKGGGARVREVFPNTAASAFGLQKDDVILEINGEPVADQSVLSSKIKQSGEGFPATLRIRRAGNEFTQSVQLGALPR